MNRSSNAVGTAPRAAARPILLLLRVPPPYGGGEILHALLKQHLEGEPDFIISTVSDSRATRRQQGRLDWHNVRTGIRRVCDACRQLRRHRPAVVYLNIPKGFAAFLWIAAVATLARWMGTRVCGELAGMRFEFFAHRGRRAFGLAVLRRFHSIRFLGEHVREAHAAYRLPRPVVFSNGVDAPACAPRNTEFARRSPLELLYVGSLEESKGVGTIVEAAALAQARGLPVHWTLVGDWASARFRAATMARVEEAGLAATVEFTGLVTGDARWQYFQRAHVLVHPTRLDGQPVSILEAMSQGVAVIGTPVGAIPDTMIAGRNGVILKETTPGALLEAVDGYLADRDALLRTMRANREDYLVRFTAETYLRDFRQWLESSRADVERVGTPVSAPAVPSAVRPRQILLLLRLPPPYGGGEIRASWLAKHVKGNRRYKVLAMRNPSGSKANQGRLVPTNFLFAGRRIFLAWWMLARHRPDVLFVAIPKNLAAFLWAAVVSIPATWAGVRVCGGLAGMRLEFFDTPWKTRLGLAVLRRFHSIRFLGHEILEQHRSYGLPHPVVFYNGVEAPASEPRTEAFARAEPLHLLYVGSLEPSKGVGVILEAAALALARRLPVRWTLVGEWASPAFRVQTMAQLADPGLAAVVELPGLVTGDARWAYYRRAHVMVHPTRLDGQPLSILEAMSQGLAVISTPVGAISETVLPGRNGELLEDASPERLLEAVKEYLDDRDRLLRTMRTNREDYLARFTVDRYVARQCEWLEAVADNRVDAFASDAAPGPGGGRT